MEPGALRGGNRLLAGGERRGGRLVRRPCRPRALALSAGANAGGVAPPRLGRRGAANRLYAARGAQPAIDIPAVVATFSDATAPEDRLALLAGQQASGEAAGRTICSCYGVGERQIAQAIDEGCGTVEALGKRLRCGTNCGSCIPELKQRLARQPA
ncbi:hypothetical protein SODG_002514 [Sodalis praecaptivus]